MKSIFLNILLIISLLAVGCSPVYYKPNLMNIPNFQKKDDVYLAAHLGGGVGDVQAAYAVGNHVAILGNYTQFSNTQEDGNAANSGETKTTKTRGNIAEFAVGYFTPISENFTFALYGGYGSGSVENDWNVRGNSQADVKKLFVQPTFGVKFKNWEFVAGYKLANLTYYNLNQNYTEQAFIDNFEVLKRPIPILESGYAVRFGFEKVKFQLQLASVRLINAPSKTESGPKFSFESASIGVGICVQLNTKKSVK